MTDATLTTVPGYRTGTWVLDPSHSEVHFTVRHMMISKVRGTFGMKSATIEAPENPLEATVTAQVDIASVDTGDAKRDEHLRSADFFDIAQYPTMDFRSTGVRVEGDDFLVDGELTMHGVTRPITLDFSFGGFGSDPWGNYKAGATATTKIDREEFGLTWNAALETGGVLVGKEISVELDLQFALQS